MIYKLSKNDYWDAENELFVIYADNNILIDLEIYDSNRDCNWYCYLEAAKYDRDIDTYKLEYKKY